MDIASALADLSEISSQIELAVVFAPDGAVLGSTGADEARAERLARSALQVLDAAAEAGTGPGRALTQVEASLREGSLFVVAGEERGIAATTTSDPTSGLVFYDLRTCLRAVDAEPAKPRRRPKRKEEKAGA